MNYYNCHKMNHIIRNCSNFFVVFSRNAVFKKIIIENIENEKSKKKIIFIEIVVKMNDVFNENESIKFFFRNLKDNFYENLKIESCILKRSKSTYLINAMINSDCSDYSFINKTIVREMCEKLNINSMRLIKSKTIKKYDEKPQNVVTHVLFFHLTVQNYIENLTFMMIVHLNQQDLILNKFGLRKTCGGLSGNKGHYFFQIRVLYALGCLRLFIFKRKSCDAIRCFIWCFYSCYSINKNVEKKNESQSGLLELKKIETKSSVIMQKGKIYKKKLINQESTKKERMINKSGRNDEKIINIVMINAAPFDLLTKDKEVEIFAISLKDVNYELKKKSKIIIDSKIIIFQKYHDFLNVFFKKTIDIFFSHRKYDHKIELLEKKKHFHMYLFIACQKASYK